MIGTGANDPQKMDPKASRETLDHSIMYIFAVALQDGRWHHVAAMRPNAPARPTRCALWHKISTVEDPEWTRRYHATTRRTGLRRARRGADAGRRRIVDEMAVADAHPLGASRSGGRTTSGKFRKLADGVIASARAGSLPGSRERLPS